MKKTQVAFKPGRGELIEKEVLQVGNLLQNRGTTQDFQKKHCVKKTIWGSTSASIKIQLSGL